MTRFRQSLADHLRVLAWVISPPRRAEANPPWVRKLPVHRVTPRVTGGRTGGYQASEWPGKVTR